MGSANDAEGNGCIPGGEHGGDAAAVVEGVPAADDFGVPIFQTRGALPIYFGVDGLQVFGRGLVLAGWEQKCGRNCGGAMKKNLPDGGCRRFAEDHAVTGFAVFLTFGFVGMTGAGFETALGVCYSVVYQK